MQTILERFITYCKIDTQSDPDSAASPSTEKQKQLSRLLYGQLQELGLQTQMDAYGNVFAWLEPNITADCSEGQTAGCPAIGLIAHVDTASDVSGANVSPEVIKNYDGCDVRLGKDKTAVLSVKEFPFLASKKGQDLIVTDGSTLLGADDKAGVAEIMAFAEYAVNHPEFRHGKVCIAFTVDEEVGRGTEHFDAGVFGADFAYTVDGGEAGSVNFENFNGASARIRINGVNIHPGSAKNKMKNSLLIAMEFDALLRQERRPHLTDGYDGFQHLTGMSGTVEKTEMEYIIRDHDRGIFERQKHFFAEAAAFLNAKYGEGTAETQITDSYGNMREIIMQNPLTLDLVNRAVREAGLEPYYEPIRGGTDGARLTYNGLPCPNIGTGGYNFHSRYECITVQDMERVVRIITKIIELGAKELPLKT